MSVFVRACSSVRVLIHVHMRIVCIWCIYMSHTFIVSAQAHARDAERIAREWWWSVSRVHWNVHEAASSEFKSMILAFGIALVCEAICVFVYFCMC